MERISIVKWLRNISIARKLYFTVGIMALLIAVELMTLMFAISTLSSVRTYVGAEGLWSKAQKDAIYSLQKYGVTHDEKDYTEYKKFLRVNLGDRKARLELQKADPDLNIVREGFTEGRLHPDDIDGAIKLVRRFHDVSYIAHAIRVWVQGDAMIEEFQQIGEQLHKEINSPAPSPEKIKAIVNQIDPVNDKLTAIEDDFSYTLGAGSRWLADLISKLLFGLVLTVEISGLSITILVSRGIAKGLNEIIRSAKTIATGDFSTRAKAFSQDEIGILAGSFNEMTDKLEQNITALRRSEEELGKSKELAEQAVVIKDHFLANMSHEIRTPMNAIIGFTDLLTSTPLNEEQKQFVDAIQVSGKNLTAIINDILDYSKIKSGMITLEHIPISIHKIMENIYVLLHQKAIEKNLAFNYYIDKDIPKTMTGDPTRLTQILSNLIDNALKFTAIGSVEVFASLVASTEEQATIQFDIKDTGKGVPADKQSIIFERFTQASAETSRRFGGTGLGLSIVKSLVELQGGTVSLTSEVNKGSVFSFEITFPKHKSFTTGHAEKENGTPDRAHPTKLRILYAEDNPLNQMLVIKFAKNYGFDLDTADNGKIATEKLQQKNYDLVLMDIQMPEMDGYEATTVIRNDLKSNIPIIALTAHAMSGEKEKCMGLGMNDFVTKPFDPKELSAKILAFFKV